MMMRRERTMKGYKQQAAKYRLRRRSSNLLREIVTSILCLGAIGMMSAVFIYGFGLLYSSPLLETKSVVVRGCNELTEKEVLTLAHVREGVNILAVNTASVAERVRRNPWVKEVHVGREYPNRIVIDVKERSAVALIKQGDEMYLLDREGIAFKLFAGEDNVDLPVLTGFSAEKTGRDPLLARALGLIDFLNNNRVVGPIESVAEIHGDERMGISIVTTTGMCLVLGFDNFEGKLTRLPLIMADLERRSVKKNYLRIDLSDPTKVTVQPARVPASREPATPEVEVKI